MTAKTKISAMIALFVGVVILFTAIAQIYPTAADAGDQLNASNQCTGQSCFFNSSRTTAECTAINTTPDDTTACGDGSLGFPFATLFAGGGIVFLIAAAAMLFLVIRKAQQK